MKARFTGISVLLAMLLALAPVTQADETGDIPVIQFGTDDPRTREMALSNAVYP